VGAFGQRVPLFALAPPVPKVGAGQHELPHLRQSGLHGQAPQSTTGWKVQNPPSAGTLRRNRSIASAWVAACPVATKGSLVDRLELAAHARLSPFLLI
jgi:hypothetical protein